MTLRFAFREEVSFSRNCDILMPDLFEKKKIHAKKIKAGKRLLKKTEIKFWFQYEIRDFRNSPSGRASEFNAKRSLEG